MFHFKALYLFHLSILPKIQKNIVHKLTFIHRLLRKCQYSALYTKSSKMKNNH